MRLIQKMRSTIVGSLLLVSLGSSSLIAAAPSGGSNLMPNSTINYGQQNPNCSRSMTKHFFCDLCNYTFSSNCGCTSNSLPPDTDLGFQQGTPTSQTFSFTGCFSASTQAQAQAQIPAGATNIKLTSSTSGSFCFSWDIQQIFCKFPSN